MTEHRPGGHWRVTIVEEGVQPPDDSGHRPDASLRAVVMDGKVLTTDPELASWVCTLLSAEICNCGHEGLDAMFHLGDCVIAESWRRQREAARDA